MTGDHREILIGLKSRRVPEDVTKQVNKREKKAEESEDK